MSLLSQNKIRLSLDRQALISDLLEGIYVLVIQNYCNIIFKTIEETL